MSVSRLGLALVFLLFGVPLFVGLRSVDLETDEAIYSFAVDRILEVGDWLRPRYSPDEQGIFLEKPPLKFWIVAAPIKAGLLPHDEFGLRFWDALAGSVAFLYVFAIGWRLAGAVCGGVAVLLLFVHGPLVFEHGLRTNNMEGMLFLCYCGGVFHFLRWAGGRAKRPAADVAATALYFVLGFMTKFVAAIFLPAVLGGAALLVAAGRQALVRDFRLWLRASLLALALIAPWFIYGSVVFGATLWETMLGQHVYARFTTSLNPMHIEPRWFYFTSMFGWFARAGMAWLVAAGSLVLVVQSIRRRWLDGVAVCLWGMCLLIISAGSSKLYHYSYPFLPPFALAAGYLAALIAIFLPRILARVAARLEDWLSGPRHLARTVPSTSSAARRPRLHPQRAGRCDDRRRGARLVLRRRRRDLASDLLLSPSRATLDAQRIAGPHAARPRPARTAAAAESGSGVALSRVPRWTRARAVFRRDDGAECGAPRAGAAAARTVRRLQLRGTPPGASLVDRWISSSPGLIRARMGLAIHGSWPGSASRTA
jgi:hypothetical protein